MANVKHPNHYQGTIEVWDFILAQDLDFFEGNIVKYICRWKRKNGIEDLKKAEHYLEKLIAIEVARAGKPEAEK